MPDTVGMTLRPTRELLNDYTIAAAERTKAKGRERSTEMREPLGRGIDRLRDAMQVLPSRLEDARQFPRARDQKKAGARLSFFSLRACEKWVKRP